jgi:hypothetical protein
LRSDTHFDVAILLRHCEQSEAIQALAAVTGWIASAQTRLAMTKSGSQTFVFFANEVFDIHRATFAGVQRTQALVDISAKRVELFDMREKLATDLFLVGFRQPSKLSNGLF